VTLAYRLRRRVRRTDDRPIPQASWRRLVAAVLATLVGWSTGTGGVGAVLALQGLREVDDVLWPWRLAATLSTIGCVIAFPLALVWLALVVRPGAPILRIEVAPGFGAACGAGFGFFVSLAGGAAWLGVVALLEFTAFGALVGASTWTAFAFLARWLAERPASEQGSVSPPS